MPIEIKICMPGHKRPVTLTTAEIFGLLGRERLTVGEFATRIGKSREAVSRFLNGRAEFPEVRKAVAAELAKMLQRLPEQYIRAIGRAA